jgi:urease accessory protein
VSFVVIIPLSRSTAFAHTRGGEALGLSSGLLHPVSGLDHVLAMIAVGLWGAQLGAPALPLALVTGLAIALGLLNGGLNGIELAAAGSSRLAVAGCAIAVSVFVCLLAGQVVALRAWSARVAVRVAGSWIAAIGMLILGWSLRPGA